MTADPIATGVSVLALAVSAVTAWLTLFHRGTVKMTRPTQIFFGADSSRWGDHTPTPKIYLRALLFATSKRGRVVENMHVVIARDGEHQSTFNIWVYGEMGKLVRGSGLFVGETGVEANHHFLVAPDSSAFRFGAGRYQVEVFAHVLGDRQQKLLFTDVLELAPHIAREMQEADSGVYFDWAPDSSHYVAHVERRSPISAVHRQGENRPA
ncbi:hypothetical protein ACFSHT_09015 [Paraburkholderia silviterrae]|uniref:Uncharacterized protein n=1 Tax=Paraburkholderia silviterrae TaxID=2528715 RepID=A0A4R5MEE3_9BURK|nr:hypothetical protein [Paraburkholderia silviterrae]TDG25133.1 hypothetical protein EYW47_04525 [Paraburkholderia silviterrae]